MQIFMNTAVLVLSRPRTQFIVTNFVLHSYRNNNLLNFFFFFTLLSLNDVFYFELPKNDLHKIKIEKLIVHEK